MLDPVLESAFSRAGLNCREAFLADIVPGDLALFDVIVLMRSPLPGHSKDDSQKWRKLLPSLAKFVNKGGGLVIMFSESYGKSVGTLNELGKLFDIQFLFNKLVDKDPKHNTELPNMPEGKLITCKFSGECEFAPQGELLDLIVDGGHGTQHLTCLPGTEWKTAIQGAETCASLPFPDGHYANSGQIEISTPVLAAYREYGKGRIAAFPGSSAFWLANACLRRWGSQILNQHQGAGYNFLAKLLEWSGAKSPGGDIQLSQIRFGNRQVLKQHDYSYRYLDSWELDGIKDLKPHRTWIGTIPGRGELPDTVEKIRSSGYEIGVFIVDYATLNSDNWREFRKHCETLSVHGKFLALPAFEQADGEGNYCVVFNVDNLPEMRNKYPNSNMLEDLLVKLNSYSAVFARPEKSRIPPWRHGGYNLLETVTEDDFVLYHDRISSTTFLSAVYIDRSNNPGKAKFDNWLMAAALKNAPASIRENRHGNFVSSGPVIKRFYWNSGPVMLDDWEGFWLEWEDGDTAEIDIELAGKENIAEVKLWDGENIIKTWTPNAKSFTELVKLPMKKDLRLHLTAADISGGKLAASWPLYTRNRNFWAHVGSDQMNDYHNVWIEDPNGSIGVGNRIYETCGFVTIGYGWGDYLRIAPPINWGDIMPQGVEVSSMVSNLQSFHPSPFINLENGFDFLNNHRRKLGECTSHLHIVHSSATGSCLEQPEVIWKAPDGRSVSPTRNITESKLWRAETEYHIPKWQPGRSCEITVEMQLEWLKDYTFAPHATFSVGHSMHFLKDNLRFRCGDIKIPAVDFLMDFREKQPEPNKEWDNLRAVKLLATPVFEGISVEVPLNRDAGTSGDPLGDFLFKAIAAPGQVYMRGWRHNPGFILSFEINPEQKKVEAGTVMDIRYALIVTPGNFTN